MITGDDKLDINFVDGDYPIYHSQFKRKAHRTNIRPNNINNKYNTSGGSGTNELCYGRTTRGGGIGEGGELCVKNAAK